MCYQEKLIKQGIIIMEEFIGLISEKVAEVENHIKDESEEFLVIFEKEATLLEFIPYRDRLISEIMALKGINKYESKVMMECINEVLLKGYSRQSIQHIRIIFILKKAEGH